MPVRSCHTRRPAARALVDNRAHVLLGGFLVDNPAIRACLSLYKEAGACRPLAYAEEQPLLRNEHARTASQRFSWSPQSVRYPVLLTVLAALDELLLSLIFLCAVCF